MLFLLKKRLLSLNTPDDGHFISKQELDSLKLELENMITDDERRKQIDLRLSRMSQKAVSHYLGPLKENISQLAEQEHKNILVSITGDDIRVSKRLAPFLRTLIHLLRNSVDHGIEAPEDRGNKSPQGKIELSFQIKGKTLGDQDSR